MVVGLGLGRWHGKGWGWWQGEGWGWWHGKGLWLVVGFAG